MIKKLKYKLPTEGLDDYIDNAMNLLDINKRIISDCNEIFSKESNIYTIIIHFKPTKSSVSIIEEKSIPIIEYVGTEDNYLWVDSVLKYLFDIFQFAGDKMKNKSIKIILRRPNYSHLNYSLGHKDLHSEEKINSLLKEIMESSDPW